VEDRKSFLYGRGTWKGAAPEVDFVMGIYHEIVKGTEKLVKNVSHHMESFGRARMHA